MIKLFINSIIKPTFLIKALIPKYLINVKGEVALIRHNLIISQKIVILGPIFTDTFPKSLNYIN